MPVIFQKFIFREDLRNNPNTLYIFGDNLHRKGLGGQAKEMRGEPNAVGIATKAKPSQLKNSFFSDRDFDLFLEHWENDMIPVFRCLACGETVIIPSDGIGTGLSELPTRAPEINAFIVNAFKELRRKYG